MRAAVAFLAALCLASCTSAVEPASFAYFDETGGIVRDGAEVLSPEAERQLTQMIESSRAAYGPQLAIVTVKSLEGYSIEDFALAYARAWGLGDAQRDDGLLLLVAPTERRVRIEVGTGLDGTFTDLFCRAVIDERILPHFRDGDIEAGIVSGAKALTEHMQQVPAQPANDNQTASTEEAA